MSESADVGQMSVNEVCQRIKRALRERSGKTWSVTHGRGTAYGWLKIDAPPARRVFTWNGLKPADGGEVHNGFFSSLEDRYELARLLAIDAVHPQGISIPASTAYRREYVDRAEGREPSVIGTLYWD